MALRRATFIAVGYVCAVFVAVFATFAVEIVLWLLPAAGRSVYDPNVNVPFGLALGLITTFATVLPGFVFTLCIAWVFRLRGWMFFTTAGVLNVFPAVGLLNMLLILDTGRLHSLFSSSLALRLLPGGFLGGLSFWQVAYRSSDAWPKDVKA
ncbi:hypothetical protein [Aminobacter sp. BE322]|uniref:hypothetical protein n=1 Tax=unclassified Aminobacter TaxID=2644704 RepID=UPI003D20A317